MFVRKGTVIRKQRGSGRKSIRRPARESNSYGAVPRKVTIHDDPPSAGSSSYRLPGSPDYSSSASFRMPGEEKYSSRDVEDCMSLRQMRTEDRYSAAVHVDDKIYQDHVKPSPARSIVVSNELAFGTCICVNQFLKHVKCMHGYLVEMDINILPA